MVREVLNRNVIILTFLLLCYSLSAQNTYSHLYDRYHNLTDLSFEQAVGGINIPNEILDNLTLLGVKYLGFDSLEHTGQLLVNSDLSEEISEIFKALFNNRFPIEKIIPIARYNWSDELSMQDNNTSCFNYRRITSGKGLSLHAYGRAIDINPKYNPYIANGSTMPKSATYDPSNKGTITSDSKIVSIFKSYGWKWGGDWKYIKDYQHFYKPR